MPRVSSFFWCECPNFKKVGTFPALVEYSCSYSYAYFLGCKKNSWVKNQESAKPWTTSLSLIENYFL